MSTTTTFPLLTVDYLRDNIGKEITWHAYGDRSNFPMKGVCKLLGLETKDGRTQPVVEHIKGDDLSFGWVENDYITYSDSGRPVKIGSSFDLYNVVYDVESLNLRRSAGNPMRFGIVVPLGADPTEYAKRRVTATEFELEHIV